MSNASHNWGFDPNDPLKGATVCPHCRGVTRTEIDDEMRYVCGVCGGPRVRVSGDHKLSGDEVEALRHGDKLRKKRAAWRFGGGVSAAAGTLLALAAVFAKVFLGASFAAAGVTAVMALPFFLLTFWAVSRAKVATMQLAAAVDRAWQSAARDQVRAAGQPLSAAQLRKALPLSQPQAEQLMAQLSVDDMLASRINDAGELVFSAAADDNAGLRIAAADPLEARFRELEAEQEAAAAEAMSAEAAEAAAEQRRRRDG